MFEQETLVDFRREKASAVNGGCSFSILGRERSYAEGFLGECGGVEDVLAVQGLEKVVF